MEKIMKLAGSIPEMQKKAEINEQRLIEIHQMLKYLSKREIEREKQEFPKLATYQYYPIWKGEKQEQKIQKQVKQTIDYTNTTPKVFYKEKQEK